MGNCFRNTRDHLIGIQEEVPVTSLTHSNIETRMDRPKSVVRVIRGVAQTVHVSRLFVAGIKFWYVRNALPQSIRLRLSVLVATGPAREREVYPELPQMEKIICVSDAKIVKKVWEKFRCLSFFRQVVYGDRRTKRLLHFRHHSFRCRAAPTPSDITKLCKKDMIPREEKNIRPKSSLGIK